MPAILPALAGFAAAGWATAGFTVGVMGMGVMASSVVVGALAGAVVGGLTAAITGGDIGEGLLYGVVGGAVGGVIGGFFGADVLGAVGIGGGGGGAQPSATALSVSANENAMGAAVAGGGKVVGGGTLPGTAGFFSSDMAKYGLISAAGQGFSGLMSNEPYATSEEGSAAALASAEKRNTENNTTNKDINAENLAYKNKELATINQQFYDNLAKQQSEFDRTLAQRRYETDLPIAEAEAARQRQRETAAGLTLSRKQAEATRPTEIQDELNQYIYG